MKLAPVQGFSCKHPLRSGPKHVGAACPNDKLEFKIFKPWFL